MEELKTLEALEIDIFDFPLDHEIIEMGDYYHDPSLPEDQITYMYALVPTNFISPIGNYEVLERLILPPLESDLTRAALSNKGLKYPEGRRLTEGEVGDGILYDREPENGKETKGTEKSVCPIDCPAYPCCLLDTEMDCEEDCGLAYTPSCLPTDPDWPKCLYDTGGNTYSNDCGCEVYNNPRKPGGCIRLEDTQLVANTTIDGDNIHLDPVRQVKVVYMFGLFSIRSTWTDDNGCWKINKEDKGKSFMWVKFKSKEVKISGIRTYNPAETYTTAISTVSDLVGSIYGPVFNDINIIYRFNGGPLSIFEKSKLYWYAATANNALHEYSDFGVQDGIGVPLKNLDVLLTNFGGTAATPMLDKIAGNPLAGYNDILVATSATLSLVNFANGGLAVNLLAFRPDVVYNYGDESDRPSDQVRSTFYHEYGHAAHYAALPPLARDDYWVNNIEYIIDNATNGFNPPYGFGGLPGSDRCGVIETWGYHIGASYADRRYGLLHSNNFNLSVQRGRYLNILEGGGSLTCNGGMPCDFRFVSGYIPQGVFLDCIDNNITDYPVVYEDPGITDGVSGFTHADCFNSISLNGGVLSVEGVRDLMRTTYLPPGQAAAAVNILFAGYGY